MVCFVLVPSFAVATENEKKELGFWFEYQTASNGLQRIIGWYEHEIVGPFGFYVLAGAESGDYREAYAGPTWRPFPELQVGVGVGMENQPSSTRYNAFFDLNLKKIAIFGTFETGGSGPWHKVTAIYKITDTVGAGLMDETGFGIGPRAQYNIWKNVQLWGAVFHNYTDTEKTTMMLAVNFSF